jgi:hypothetical protein
MYQADVDFGLARGPDLVLCNQRYSWAGHSNQSTAMTPTGGESIDAFISGDRTTPSKEDGRLWWLGGIQLASTSLLLTQM